MLAKQLPRASSIGLPIVEEFATSLLLQDSYRINSSLRIYDTHRGYISQRTVLNMCVTVFASFTYLLIINCSRVLAHAPGADGHPN